MGNETWTHLVRIKHKGKETFGQLVDPKENGDLDDQIKVNIATGSPVHHSIKLTGEIVTVAKQDLLAPIAKEEVPIVGLCGLNYDEHVTEAVPYSWKDLRPPMPYIFYRPATSIAAPYPKSLRVYKCQQECLDYEGEMAFQIDGASLKDITVEEARKHIIGFTVGIDFSPRPGKVLGRMNYIFAKSFDDWTPLGPVLINPSVVGIQPKLNMTTKWNGKIVQSDNTGNMIFSCAEILASMSTGTTIPGGAVIWTGTCGGGVFFPDQGVSQGIQDGDEIIVEIEKIGKVVAYPKFD